MGGPSRQTAGSGERSLAPLMLGRLRWSVRGLLPVTSPVVMAQAFAYLYGIGATLVLLSLLLPHDPDRWVPGLVAAGADRVRGRGADGDRLRADPDLALPAAAGAGGDPDHLARLLGRRRRRAAYATIYFWAVLSAYYFLELRYANVTLLVCFAGFAVAMAAQGDTPDPVLNWVLVATTLTVAGLLIALLRQRSERLVALLGEAQDVAHIGSWEWHIPSDEVAWSDELYRIHGLRAGRISVELRGAAEPRAPGGPGRRSTARSTGRSTITRRSPSSTASSGPTASSASCTAAVRS